MVRIPGPPPTRPLRLPAAATPQQAIQAPLQQAAGTLAIGAAVSAVSEDLVRFAAQRQQINDRNELLNLEGSMYQALEVFSSGFEDDLTNDQPGAWEDQTNAIVADFVSQASNDRIAQGVQFAGNRRRTGRRRSIYQTTGNHLVANSLAAEESAGEA